MSNAEVQPEFNPTNQPELSGRELGPEDPVESVYMTGEARSDWEAIAEKGFKGIEDESRRSQLKSEWLYLKYGKPGVEVGEMTEAGKRYKGSVRDYAQSLLKADDEMRADAKAESVEIVANEPAKLQVINGGKAEKKQKKSKSHEAKQKPLSLELMESESVNENIKKYNKFIEQGGVPTINQLKIAESISKKIDIRSNPSQRRGERSKYYFDEENKTLDHSEAEDFIKFSNPEFWVLSKEQKASLKTLAKSESSQDLSAGNKLKLLKEYEKRIKDREPLSGEESKKVLQETYESIKGEAKARLELNKALKDSKKSEAVNQDSKLNTRSAKERGIDDLLPHSNTTVDRNGRVHENGNWSRLTSENLDQIEALQDEIREGLPEHRIGELTQEYSNAIIEFRSKIDARMDTDAPFSDEELTNMSINLRNINDSLAEARGIAKDSDEYKKLEESLNLFLDKAVEDLENHESKMIQLTKDYFGAWETIYRNVEAKQTNKKLDLTRENVMNLSKDVWDNFEQLAKAKGWAKESEEYKNASAEVQTALDDLMNKYEESRNWRDKIREGKDKLVGYFGDEEKGKKRKMAAIGLGAIGVAAAATGVFFGIEGGAGHHIANSAGHGVGHKSVGGPPLPNVGRTPSNLNINPDQYTWSVAHQLSPGNETTVMQNALNHFNSSYGTNFALTPHAGSVWIMEGGKSIDPSQMHNLNELMLNLSAA